MNNGFWQMGGYALYVWSAYGLVLSLLGFLWLSFILEHRALVQKIRDLSQ